MTTRRRFLHLTAAAGGALGLGLTQRVAVAGASPAPGAASPPGAAPAPRRSLEILILGGTGFIGPSQVEYALERGHQVTLFNRGKSKPGLFKGRVEELVGDRNGNLKALEGRNWDVVIDNPTTLPVWVRDAGKLLAGHAGHYIFVSTISVYSDNSKPGADETAPLATYAGSDAMAETMDKVRANMELYGPLKVLSEKEAERWFPGKTTIVRPGLIVGPGDPTDRFTYWPVRIARGGTVLAPGDPGDDVQIIDVRDLSEFVIRLAEAPGVGTYNATGPASPLSIAEMLHGIRAVTTVPVEFVWVDTDFLTERKVAPWGDMPVWVPPRDGMEGFARISIRRALDAGLTFRPLATTAADTLAWWATLPAQRREGTLGAGLSTERERELLTAWAARKSAPASAAG